MALGAVATMQGIGAATSGLLAEVTVDHFGYSAAFLTSGAAAAVALAALVCPDCQRTTIGVEEMLATRPGFRTSISTRRFC